MRFKIYTTLYILFNLILSQCDDNMLMFDCDGAINILDVVQLVNINLN